MKQIKLKRISLLNFKGIRNLTLEFTEQTTICGANGTGKTTIFDAFTWLLFGKDCQDRKDFDIKTIGTDGKAIPRIPHEVSAILDIDGLEATLRKTYSEKWTKRRGAAEEVFEGHEVEYFYNDVPLKASEYNARIADICPEQTFKLITNPLYFTAQKPDMQRQLLFRLAGEVTDKEILDNNAGKDFESVLALLSGKTLNDLKREIASKKKTIKEACESIPARIDERRRNENKPRDWNALAVGIANLKNEISVVNNSVLERTKAYDIATAERQKISKQIAELQMQVMQRRNDLQAELMSGYYTAKSAHDSAVMQMNELLAKVQSNEGVKKHFEVELEQLNVELNNLLTKWKSIQAEEFVVADDQFICPTCKRMLEASDIAAKKSEMESNFNEDKVRRLENNKQSGLDNKSRIDTLKERIARIDNINYDIMVEIGNLKHTDAYLNEPQMPQNIESLISSDAQIIKLQSSILGLQTDFDKEIEKPNCEDLIAQRNELETQLREAQVALSERDAIEANNTRIAELEAEYHKQQEALAELEKTEYNINQFSKARVQAIEGRVNSMFRMVKFKLFDTLINGSEVETCEATVDGVPFSTLNQARQMNVGLDIINTICEKEEISAPIVIDNRESISEIVAPIHSQIINLYVNPDYKQLTIL